MEKSVEPFGEDRNRKRYEGDQEFDIESPATERSGRRKGESRDQTRRRSG
jgi:hypothetical protein